MGNTRKIETTLSDHHNRLQNKPDQLQDKYEHNQHTTCTNARGLAEQHAEMLGGHTNCFFRSGMGMSGQLSRENEKHPNGDRPTTERTTTHERSRHRQSRSSKHLANPSQDTGREPQSRTKLPPFETCATPQALQRTFSGASLAKNSKPSPNLPIGQSRGDLSTASRLDWHQLKFDR